MIGSAGQDRTNCLHDQVAQVIHSGDAVAFERPAILPVAERNLAATSAAVCLARVMIGGIRSTAASQPLGQLT